MQPLTQTRKVPHLFTVAEYLTLDITDRTELLGGVIYEVSPRNEPHRHAVRRLTRALARGLDPRYIAQIQDAVAVPGWAGKDAPEVDVAIIEDRFYDPCPTACDAIAFVEVSDTTYADDRNMKIPLYVSASVAAWIVNIPLRQVEFYGSANELVLPHGHVFTCEQTVEIAGVAVPVAELFEVSP